MRKLVKWALITFGIAALARWWRGRGSGDMLEAPSAPAPPVDPADELRRKLAESRSQDEPAGEGAETSVDERRAEVHAEGRAAIDEMQSSRDDA